MGEETAFSIEDLLATRTRKLLSQRGPSFAPPRERVFRLGGGIPDPAVFPIKELSDIFARVLEREGELALQYGGPQGYLGLREALARWLSERDGLELSADGFMLTGGASQALDNVCFALLEPGDAVIYENPTFTLSLRTIAAHGAEISGVPLDGEGPDEEALWQALEAAKRKGRRVKFIYVTPNFQNPTGVTFSLRRRQAVLELAERYGCLIVEDDAYGDLRYEGEHILSFFSLAGGSGVVRLGTFSKTIGPGLRLGWSQAEPQLMEALAAMRTDMGTSPLVAHLVAAYLAEGHFQRHLQEVIDFYRDKRDRFLSALAERFDGIGRWQTPEGGFFVWLELPPGADGGAVAEAAMVERVMVAPGARFYCRDPQSNYLRLAFSFIAEEEMDEALTRLARAARKVTG